MSTESRRKADAVQTEDEAAIKRRDRNSLILFAVIFAVAITAMLLISKFLSGA